MITVDFVRGAIDGLVSRFKKSQLHIARHYYEVECEEGEPYEVHFYIEDDIKTMLDGLNIKSDVRLIDMHRTTGIDVYVLIIAFVVNGELFTVDFIVEGDNY